MPDCTVSLVVYNNPAEMLREACESLFRTSLDVRLYVVDNSPAPSQLFAEFPADYLFADANLGYGQGHNLALRHAVPAKYHLIMNPDVIIHQGALEALAAYMDDNPHVGLTTPRVMSEDGTPQYLNKRYPTVFDLFVGRFIPVSMHRLIQRRLDLYKMKDVGYEGICDVEFTSGCFMFCRTDALTAVGGFDDRYFMYLEDVDLDRKIQQAGYRTVYYPHAAITHLWQRASHKSIKMTGVFIISMFRYFNKWGWKWF